MLGAATCVVTFYLVDAMARRRVALAAALLLALDPLAISFDSRVMLEAPAQLATVSMILFVVLADRYRPQPAPPAQPAGGGRVRRRGRHGHQGDLRPGRAGDPAPAGGHRLGDPAG